jgi:hypothetical protein
MDNYPADLAPRYTRSGNRELFEEWWLRVSDRFSRVPREVAQYWLYEHWGQSPYSYLLSHAYCFSLTHWPAGGLAEVRSIWCDFDPQNIECLKKGRELVEEIMLSGEIYCTASFMTKHGDFPTPIIVLDNRGRSPEDQQDGRYWGGPAVILHFD